MIGHRILQIKPISLLQCPFPLDSGAPKKDLKMA
jgi:hypothetical protein